MPLYTKEQIENANRISLVEYLRLKGEKLKRTGNEYKWIYTDSQGEHCSVSINENKWYDHKNETGGYTVSFLQEFYGLTFPEAMHELLDGESPKLCTTVQGDSGKKQKPDFVLPPRAKNMKRLFGYLIKKRFISSEVIKFFAEQKLIYQEAEHGNIVFVGMDEKGKPVSACLKSVSEQYRHFKVTVEGSDMRYGFCYRGTGEKLFVFEAAVDLLSYLTLYPENWKEQSYLALDGLSPKALLQFVNTQKNIKSVYICVDYDTAGIEAWDKFKDLLLENGYKPEQVNRILPM